MSPRSTLKNWGNSSRLVRLKNEPSRLSRCPSGRGVPSGLQSSVMVRNLYRRKMRPCHPTRSWMKMAGGPIRSTTRQAITAPKGRSTAIATTATTVSRIRFTCHRPRQHPEARIRVRGPACHGRIACERGLGPLRQRPKATPGPGALPPASPRHWRGRRTVP